jgi:hypothetical protein
MTTTSSGDPSGRDEIPHCPACGSHDIRRYAYGYIRFENEEKKQRFDQKFVMGGCAISDKSPHFHCDACGADYE